MEDQALSTLNQTLSADEATRRHAEEQLKQLSFHPGMSLALCSMRTAPHPGWQTDQSQKVV